MPSALKQLRQSELNQIARYLYYRLNPKELGKREFNDIPGILGEFRYSPRTQNFQILEKRFKDEENDS